MFDFLTCGSLWPLLWLALAGLFGYLLRSFNKGKVSTADTQSYSKSTTTTVVANKSELEVELQDWKNRYQVVMNNQESSVAEYKNKVQAAEDRANTFSKKATELTSKFDGLEAEKSEFSNRLRNMQTERDEAKTASSELNSKLALSESKVKEANETLKTIKASFVEQAAAAAGAAVSYSATSGGSSDEVNSLKQKLSETKASLDVKDKRIIDLLSKEALAKELQSRLQAQHEKLENLDLQVKAATGTPAETAAIIADKDKKLADAQANAANELAKLKAKIDEMEKDRHRQAENLNEYRHEVSAERAAYEKKISELEINTTTTPIVNEVVAEPVVTAVPEVIAEPVAEVEETKAEPVVEAAVTEEVTNTATASGYKQDDLKVVEGIGPKVEGLFHAKGITTWSQLSKLSKAEVEEVLESGGDRFRILNGNSWPKQAELLADGKWGEFKEYTDYLIAGVDPAETNTEAAAKENERVEAAKANIPKGFKWDDHKIVEGIGPVIDGILREAGIKTWKELSEMEPSEIKTILDSHGERFRVHDPSTWPNQALLAFNGKWEELQKLQDELKGGK